ncbi:MAG: hypothetical protein ACSW75_00040, partial [Lachnospiraceae bacterium]
MTRPCQVRASGTCEHVWENTYTTDQEPTVQKEGVESIHCSICGAVKDGSRRMIARCTPTPTPFPSYDLSVDVTAYTYEVCPVLEPFNEYLYVKTDNPDPTSFCICDKQIQNADPSAGSNVHYWTICRDGNEFIRFEDVQYEDVRTARVHGGYIFSGYGNSDGGELVILQRKVDPGKCYDSFNCEKDYVETDITVSCQRLTDYQSYIIENYTDPSKSLFENLDAVQSMLDNYAVYPRGVRNPEKLNSSRPYPFLTTSPYRELTLNAWYSKMFDTSKFPRLLLSNVYPYVLDSLGFPYLVKAIAEKLQPDCVVTGGDAHWEIVVTYDG